MILTGGSIDASAALRIGLLSEVLPPDKLLARSLQLDSEIAANAPLAVRAARMLAVQGLDLALPHAMLLEQLAWGALRDTADRVEGRTAFAEKREAKFVGR